MIWNKIAGEIELLDITLCQDHGTQPVPHSSLTGAPATGLRRWGGFG